MPIVLFYQIKTHKSILTNPCKCCEITLYCKYRANVKPELSASVTEVRKPHSEPH